MTMTDHPTDILPTAADRPARSTRRRWILAVVAAITIVVAVLLLTAGLWGADLRDRGLLLPGTTIAGVDVGLVTADEALTRVDAALAIRLDHEVTLEADGTSFTVDARGLAAETDAAVMVAGALELGAERSLFDLVGLRWFGTAADIALDPTVALPGTAVEELVASIAAEVDHPAVDATIAYDDAVITTTSTMGFSLDQAAAVDLVRDGVLAQRSDAIELPGEVLPPAITDEMVATARAGAEAALARALAHDVELAHPDGSWTTSPELLGAVADGERLVADALELAQDDGDMTTLQVALDIPETAVDGLVAEIAAALDIRPVNATVDFTGGTVRRLAGREGRALDRDATATSLLTALTSEQQDMIELSVAARAPARGVGALRDVLVVHQSQTRVDLYRGDDIVRSWPVAVGTGGSPTPTGTFVVGAKRFEPTWVNPALDRWGADMPARIGPGPDNPLGLRALNWNRPGGGDTLIRFHGTPNEASIGSASSNGCVRMFNEDVIELYDLVSNGTMIISLA